ncbi:MAG: Asp-tRNA(Asn)/Glu-tRNA(Gln) amidotransferase GatCAB subunit B [Spirochaetaceae bacterium]|nr:Asp-tRNA(Asn)/Glu-tRNA(Gln) amidotransferase GatCAB subunit B [Spirochaetaceae bacterium]
MSQYEPVIGLEVHCQLKTKTKIFSTDPYLYGAAANTQAGPVTLGLPGALPVLNESVMEMALTAALALDCEINRHTRFDRKHYFYPDLPKGYQISQYDRPYAINGKVSFRKKDAEEDTTIRIHRIHMEEDAGKLLHGQGGGDAVSFVDLNRAGVPLLEIVSEPDLRSSEDAYYYLQTLRSILRAVEVTDGNMEMGSLRCDANVSVRKGPDAPFGTRVEIKNLNSFKAVRAAIDYQIEEQIALIESGQKIIQSTVLWDADKRETRLMRTKENAEDYRYFPDPDLPEFVIEEDLIEKVKKEMPELPAQKRARYVSDYGLPEYDADVLTREKEISGYYEEVVRITDDPKKSSNWVKDEVLGIVNKLDVEIEDFFVNPERLGKIIKYLNEKKFTQRIAKQVFEHCYEEKLEVDDIIEKYDYKPVDTSDLPAIVDKVFADNEQQVNDILNGKDRVKGFLVGQIMKATRGQAPPDEVNRLIDEKVESLKAGS